jgi:hypothetical protein
VNEDRERDQSRDDTVRSSGKSLYFGGIREMQ